MLFKTLLASIAFAASVACYPPSSNSPYTNGNSSPYSNSNPNSSPYSNGSPNSTPYANGNANYERLSSSFRSCTQKFRDLRQPIAYSCQNQGSQEVAAKLSDLYKPVHALRIQVQTVFKVDSSIATNSIKSLIDLFIGFEGIVETLARFPAVIPYSASYIQTLNAEFDIILGGYESAGVSIRQVFTEQTSVKFESFKKVGFNFPEKFGLYGHK